MRNIVYVDDDAQASVEQLFDADVIALPITIHTTLVAVWNHLKSGTFDYPCYLVTDRDPWFRWAVENAANYEELWNYGCDIIDEHWLRFGSRQKPQYKHSSAKWMDLVGVIPPMLPKGEVTPKPTTVSEARAQYKTEIASKFAEAMNIKHTYRSRPPWL